MTTTLPESMTVRPGHMRAIRFYGPGDIRYEEMPLPEAGPGEVVLRIMAALTCGTDLKTFRRGHPVLIKRTPAVFGHEFAGVIHAVGPGVEGWEVGTRVACANSAPCNHCFYCRLDRPSLCEHLELLNGAYAQYIAIPAHIVRQNLYPIPDTLSFEHAAILEPLSCTLHGIERSEIRVGDTVGIVGVGPIGLMLIRLAKLKGARVIAVGRNTRKLTVARLMGADEVLNIQDVADPVTAVKALTPEGRGVDVAIEAVGLPEVWQKAFEVSRKGALVNLFGGCSKGTTFELDTHQLHYEERKVIGVFHHTPYHVATALKLLADGLFDPTLLITHRMSLADLPEAFRRIEAREALKVAIFPNDA